MFWDINNIILDEPKNFSFWSQHFQNPKNNLNNILTNASFEKKTKLISGKRGAKNIIQPIFFDNNICHVLNTGFIECVNVETEHTNYKIDIKLEGVKKYELVRGGLAYFENQIVGFVGIGSAPEFLERLMWRKFPKKVKKEIKVKGISHIKNGDYEYPITYQIIKDGRKNKVFSKKINSKIIVTMFHGQKDEAVPVSFSRKVLSVFTKAKKRMVVIKNGDHSLSNKLSVNKILKELDRFRNTIL